MIRLPLNYPAKLFASFAFLLGSLCSNAEPARPNIILIMADDMGYETIGAYGGTSYETPNIDSLAREGMLFENCFSQPLCTPTRVQIMTGKYNVRNYQGFGVLPKGETTFANSLRDAGYKTFIAGKWQLSEGRKSEVARQDAIRFGFDTYFLWQLNRRPQRYYAPGFEAHIPELGWEMTDIDHKSSEGTFGPELVVDQISAFIDRNRSVPFFIYYPMMLPHDPFLPTPGHPKYDAKAAKETNDPRFFMSMITATDRMVGRVLDKIDEAGLAENTLVIFCGDNGTKNNITSMVAGKKVRGGKGTATNAGTHVPLLVRWPEKVSPGSTSGQLVDFTDIFPTLAAAGDAKPPSGLDGHSLLPELMERKGSPREWSYCWYLPRNDDAKKIKEFARNLRYKLYRTGHFFDLSEDPLERQALDNNSLSEDQKNTKAALAKVLASFETDATRQMEGRRD